MSASPTFIARWFPASPLRHAAFRRFYVGSIGAALGYTMQTTVAAWLMATLTPSALMVALVQTMATAPALLFGIAAGALADIVDRRRIILLTHAVLIVVTVLLGVAEIAELLGPATLLVGMFVIGAAFAIYLPAQQASVNDMVARSEIARAVSLGAVAFNVARALGPALAGAIAAALTSGSAMLVAAIFFVAMMVAVYPKTGLGQADSRCSRDAAVGNPERAPLRPSFGAVARARHPQRELQPVCERAVGALAARRARPAFASAPAGTAR